MNATVLSGAVPPLVAAAHRREQRRGVIALARERLRRTPAARIGSACAITVAVAFGAVALALRIADGTEAALSGLLRPAAQWIACVGALPIALAASGDRGQADRRDGIVALVASRGGSSAALEGARFLAAMQHIGYAAGVPLVALALLATALGDLRSVPAHLGGAVALALFSLSCGVTLGGIASACSRAGARRGASLFAFVVLVPWLFADLAGRPAYSIPGALYALLDLALRLTLGGSRA